MRIEKEWILKAGVVFLIALFAWGCHTIVHPPRDVRTPVTLYLTDGDFHSSVLLPVGEDRYLEYSSGDWTYSAENKRDIFHALGALFFSEQAALGRRYVVLDPKNPAKSADLNGFAINPMVVDLKQEMLLANEMAVCFRSGTDPKLNTDEKVLRVKVDGHYSLFNNCNALTKDCLRKLGCEVEVGSLFAWYVVRK